MPGKSTTPTELVYPPPILLDNEKCSTWPDSIDPFVQCVLSACRGSMQSPLPSWSDTQLVSSGHRPMLGGNGDQVAARSAISTSPAAVARPPRRGRPDTARPGRATREAAELGLQQRDGEPSRRRDGVHRLGEGMWGRSPGHIRPPARIVLRRRLPRQGEGRSTPHRLANSRWDDRERCELGRPVRRVRRAGGHPPHLPLGHRAEHAQRQPRQHRAGGTGPGAEDFGAVPARRMSPSGPGLIPRSGEELPSSICISSRRGRWSESGGFSPRSSPSLW